MIRGLVLSGLATRKNATLKDAVNRLIADANDLRRFINNNGACQGGVAIAQRRLDVLPGFVAVLASSAGRGWRKTMTPLTRGVEGQTITAEGNGGHLAGTSTDRARSEIFCSAQGNLRDAAPRAPTVPVQRAMRCRPGSVLSRTSSSMTPGASSTRRRPSWRTSMTARSVMIRWTTRRPV